MLVVRRDCDWQALCELIARGRDGSPVNFTMVDVMKGIEIARRAQPFWHLDLSKVNYGLVDLSVEMANELRCESSTDPLFFLEANSPMLVNSDTRTAARRVRDTLQCVGVDVMSATTSKLLQHYPVDTVDRWHKLLRYVYTATRLTGKEDPTQV